MHYILLIQIYVFVVHYMLNEFVKLFSQFNSISCGFAIHNPHPLLWRGPLHLYSKTAQNVIM